MKKQFILFLGLGWAGTTSLFYTLQNNLQYMHGGYIKEPQYLNRYFHIRESRKDHLGEFVPPNAICITDIFEKIINHYNDLKQNIWNVNHKDLNAFADPLLKIGVSSSEFIDYISKEVNLQSYLNFYLKLAEYSYPNYQSVGDFSNSNAALNEDMLREVFNLLSPHFDVKVLIIFRDPIRRLWSMFSTRFEDNKKTQFPIKEFLSNENIADLIRSKKNIKHYSCISESAYNVFGKDNVHYVIMEDFFAEQRSNLEVSKLENFLNISIPTEKIYPCCYVPDKGINPPNIPGLRDQSSSDHRILTEENYNNIKKIEHIAYSYQLFEEFHGYLPADWGKPIDYGY